MRRDEPAIPSAVPPIDETVLQEMNRLGLPIVKIHLAAALQQRREHIPLQRPGVPGAAPTCIQVAEWVNLKEAEKERRGRRLQIWTLVFACIGALAAVISLLPPLDVLASLILRFF
jgi:hypothetical protein